MNEYEFEIKGMHCKACAGLISEELDENGISEVEISLEKNSGKIISDFNEEIVKEKLVKVFSNLKDYQYFNFHKK